MVEWGESVMTLITFNSETDGSSTTGVFSLRSDIIDGTVDYIQADIGTVLKIWAKRLVGGALYLLVYWTDDVTVPSPTWRLIDVEYLVSAGDKSYDKRRPIKVKYRTGKEAVQFRWSQATAAKSYIGLEVEFTYREE